MSRTERLRIAPWSNHAHRDVFLQKSSQDYLISSIGSDKQSNTWCASCPLAATNNQTHGVHPVHQHLKESKEETGNQPTEQVENMLMNK